MTYHLYTADDDSPSTRCGEFKAGDTIITIEEANDSDGRYFDCVECHKTLTDGQQHVVPLDM